MELALPIRHPRQPDTVLLREGVSLDALSIPHLRDLGVHELWIRYPGLENLVRFVDPLLLAEYHTLTQRLGLAIDQAMVRAPVEIDFYACRRSVLSIIARLSENPQAALWTAEVTGSERPFVRHSGNVCALSLLMGMRLDFYLVRERSRLPAHRAKDIASLGIGALFHDIGMLRLARADLARYHETGDENDPAWRAHTAIGFEMVRGVLDPAAATVVLHHHQRWDGSGFPQRASLKGGAMAVSGSEIHVFARIAAAADMIDRLTHPASAPGADPKARPSVPRVRALAQIAGELGRRSLDPVVWRALMSVCPPYPPGSMVRLSDGGNAVVTAWTPMDPCRPEVELMDAALKPRKRKGRAVRIDLREARDLSIVEVDGHDVRMDNYEPRSEGEFDLASIRRATENRAEELMRKAA